MEYETDLSFISSNFKPPNLLYYPPVAKPKVTKDVVNEQKKLTEETIKQLQIPFPNINNGCAIVYTEAWEYLGRKLDLALTHESVSTVANIELFFPRSLVAIYFCPAFGMPEDVTVECTWSSSGYCYIFQSVYLWTVTDLSKVNQAFGSYISTKVFGARNKEINFDVNNNKEVVGGWIIPNCHTFVIKYNWGSQDLKLTLSYYKYEARKYKNQLAFTKLL